MRKRKWIYAQKPQVYCISCDKCGGDNIEWSEYEHKIWCYDCQIDTDGNGGLFDGPIPLMAAQLMGINFNRVYLKEGIVKYPRLVGHKVKWFAKYKPFGMEMK